MEYCGRSLTGGVEAVDMIERCLDYRRVKRLASWPLCISDTMYYLIDVENGEDIGVWFFHPNGDAFQVHACMKDRHRGRRAARSVKECFRWMFTNTDTKRIVAAIPDAYREVCYMARHVGMSFAGVDGRAFRCYTLDRQTFEKEENHASS